MPTFALMALMRTIFSAHFSHALQRRRALLVPHGIPESSHVLKDIGLSDDEAASSIRFSLGQDTTEFCIDEAVTLIHEGLTRLADSNLIFNHQRSILS